jgi:hypothetical protein
MVVPQVPTRIFEEKRGRGERGRIAPLALHPDFTNG